jgi:hypothetical protein
VVELKVRLADTNTAPLRASFAAASVRSSILNCVGCRKNQARARLAQQGMLV